MRTIKHTEFEKILTECISYIQSTDEESIKEYFKEFIRIGLFQDAIGKIVSIDNYTMECRTTDSY